MPDPTDFASPDQIGAIRSRLLQDHITTSQQATQPDTSSLDFSAYTSQANALPTPQFADSLNFDTYVADRQQANDGLLSDLQQKAAALTLAGQPTPDERQQALSAAQRVAGVGLHGLQTALTLLDTPRRWTFENLIVPAAHAAGLTDQPIDPTGRDLFLKALGGQAATDWVNQHVSQLTGSTRAGSLAGAALGGVAGLGLDVLLDPLQYATLGAGAGLEALGGRVLAPAGEELLGTLRGINEAQQSGRAIFPLEAATAAKLSDVGATIAGPAAEARAAALAAPSGTVEAVTAASRASETARNLSELEAGLTSPGSRTITEPQLDTLFQNLRGTTADTDLFRPGGLKLDLSSNPLFHLWLPKDLASIQVPLLNREQNIGVFLGGRDITGSGATTFDGIRRSAIDLGEAALARIPVPQVVSQPIMAAGRRVRDIFVNYGYLQGIAGGDNLAQALKEQTNLPRSEAGYTQAIVNRAFQTAGPVTDEQKQQVFSLLRNGVPDYARDATGNIVMDATGRPVQQYVSLDDYADQLNAFRNQPTSTVDPTTGARVFAPKTTSGADVRAQLQQQMADLQTRLDTAKMSGLVRPDITVQDLGTVRDATEYLNQVPGTQMSAADFIQGAIDRIQSQVSNEVVPSMLATSDVIKDPVRFAQVVPDPTVRAVMSSLMEEELNLVGPHAPATITGAVTQLAQNFGQEGLLPNYLRTIYAYDAPMQRALRQLPQRIATPSNIGQQRVLTAGLQPEELQALGVVTDPEKVLATTLAQYRTQARHNQWLASVADNYGRALAPGEAPPSGWELFNPKALFPNKLTPTDSIQREIDGMRDAGALADEEAQSLQGFQALTKVQAGTYAVPSEVLKAVNQSVDATRSAGGLLSIADAYLGFMRGSVTSIWPAYHVRNLIGNLFNSHIGGVPMSDFSTLGDAVEMLRGDESNTITQRVLQKINDARGATGPDLAATINSGATNTLTNLAGPLGMLDPTSPTVRQDFMRILRERGAISGGADAVDRALAADPSRAAEGVVRGASDWLFGRGRSLGEYTDDVMRMRYILYKLNQGDSLENTILQTKKFLFDFRDLAPAERTYFKQGAFFYSWLRKNLPLQLEMMVQQPQPYQTISATMRNLGDPQAQQDADAALMPAFVREQLGITLGQADNGKVTAITGLGLPIDDINQLSFNSPKEVVGQIVGLLNPALRGALELGGMPSGFTNQRIDDDSLTSYYRRLAPPLAWVATHTPGLADWLGVQQQAVIDRHGNEVAHYTADPTKMYMLSNLLGFGRLFRTAGNIGQAAETGDYGRLATQLATGIHTTSVDLSRPLESLIPSTDTEAVDQATQDKLEALAQRLTKGEITAKQWRDLRSDIVQQRVGARNELLRQQVQADAPGAGPGDIAAIEGVRKEFRDTAGQLSNLMGDLIQAGPTGINPLTGAQFATPREYYDTRQAIQDRIAQEAPEAAARTAATQALRTRLLPPTAQFVDKQYQQAVQVFAQYQNVPKYRGVPLSQQDTVDQARNLLHSFTQSTGNPAQARAIVSQNYPGVLALVARARPNAMERRRAWVQLDRQSGGLLTRYFGDFPASEFSDAPDTTPTAGGQTT